MNGHSPQERQEIDSLQLMYCSETKFDLSKGKTPVFDDRQRLQLDLRTRQGHFTCGPFADQQSLEENFWVASKNLSRNDGIKTRTVSLLLITFPEILLSG